jgi:hypothetical protein
MKKYTPRTPKVGDVVGLTFDDHTEQMERHSVVEAFGRIKRINKKSLTIAGWDLPDETDVGNGQMIWTILRSCILTCKVLE